ncbi:MAG: histidine triad nucleotide-binding protein [Burkholderiales bacterium]|jgi:histidine triad (HIT) family protein|nr:histidine triad nucleotide-binding protein [Burkholderiales bacterium]
MSSPDDCIFCKIIRGEIPAGKVYEDDDVLAFLDIKPVAPVHVLVIPKKHIASLTQVDKTDALLLGKMLALAPALAVAQGADDGFRIIINAGRVGMQEVPHLHIHIIGGSHPLGPMLAR